VKKPIYEHPFVSYLIEKVGPDRAARAALRRTLRRGTAEAPEAFRYVVPWLPNPCSERVEGIYYLTAGLYALHPLHTGEGNLGTHLRDLAGSDERAYERLERRLEAALRAHPDDLPDHLRRLVGILRSKDKPVNYQALMGDLLAWDNDDLRAKKRWAAAFWGRNAAPVDLDQSATQSDQKFDEVKE
jgi:CRISPR system Cascade subunit CasB